MPRMNFIEFWNIPPAGIDRDAAAWMKNATRRRVKWARHLSRQDSVFARCLDNRVRYRHCREQRPGVGVPRIVEQGLAVGDLDNLSQIHDGDAAAYILHDA